MKIIELTCERLYEPLCVDVSRPRFCWCFDGDEYNCKQEAYQILVASELERLTETSADLWNSGRIESDETLDIRYSGHPLISKQLVYWCVIAWMSDGTVVRSEATRFGMGLLREIDWKGGFIGHNPSDPEMELRLEPLAGAPSPYLRRRFTLMRPIKCARLFATAFGVYEAYINGTRVGDQRMTPGWTDYRKSLQYQGYDVTELVHKGENMLGAILADGWFAGNIAIVGREQYGGYPLGLKVHLAVTYMDGTEEVVSGDHQWQSKLGAIRYSDNQTGEFYDATHELDDWMSVDSSDDGWSSCVSVSHCCGTLLKAERTPPLRVQQNLSPVRIWRSKNGWLVDIGQNMVGHIALRIRETRGTRITVRYGEMLQSEDELYTENLRTAKQTDVYIAAGKEEEWMEPHFTFHGFQYVEIIGLTSAPAVEDIQGRVVHSSCRLTGHITTSNATINRLFLNQLWGQKGNFISVPTDCPQRDERMGWTGDAQIFSRTACYNMDCAAFYEKYIEDCLESQKPNGAITNVVPNVLDKNQCDLVSYGSAAWAEAIFIIPWNVYQINGNRHILELAYPGMCRCAKYMQQTLREDGTRCEVLFGDWLNVHEETDPRVLCTAYSYYGAWITAQTATLLNKPEEAALYTKIAEEYREAFCRVLVQEDVTIAGDSQCAYILALVMNILPPEQRHRAAEHLVRTIARRDNHLATGFVGVSYLLPVLTEYGYTDLAYELLLCDTYPSWCYSVRNGATTIWERWNSYTKEDGFADTGMNSFNHYSLGSCGEWMYRYMGGIRPLTPGFHSILVAPITDNRFEMVTTMYASASGRIISRWEKTEGGYCYAITVPINTIAQIVLPAGTIPMDTSLAVRKDGRYLVGSGEYVFTYTV